MYKISCWKWHKYTNVHRVLAVTKIQWGTASWSGQFSKDFMKEDFLLSWQQKRATQETVTVGRKQEYCISYTRKFTPQNLDLEKPYMGWLVQSGAENTTKASWKCWGFFFLFFKYYGPFWCCSVYFEILETTSSDFLNVGGAQFFGFVECLTLMKTID